MESSEFLRRLGYGNNTTPPVPPPGTPYQTTPPTAPQTQPSYQGAIKFQQQSAFDFANSDAEYVTSRIPPGTNLFRTIQISGNITRWEIYIRDLSGGMDNQVLEISDGPISNELSKSTLESLYSRTLCLPGLLTEDTTAGSLPTITTMPRVSTCLLPNEIDGTAIFGVGSGANKALFTGTDVLTAQTYSPASDIVSVNTTKIATLADRVLVGHYSTAGKVLSGIDGSPTVDGTEHANLTPLWGLINSPLNSVTPGAFTILFLANGGIWSRSSTSAIGAAPTLILDGLPDGGWAIGILTLEGVSRAFWAIPTSDLGQDYYYILHTNLEGSDPKVLDIGLAQITDVKAWRNGVVATDGASIHWHNGDIVELGWNRERNWTGIGWVQQLAPVDDRLFIFASDQTSDVNNLYATTQLEEYNLDENKWYYRGSAISAAASAPIRQHVGAIPVFRQATGDFMWWLAATDGGLGVPALRWNKIPLYDSAHNPFWSQAQYGFFDYTFGTTGYAIPPIWYFHESYPKVVSEIWYGGQMVGTNSSVQVEIAVQDKTTMRFAGETSDAGVTVTTQSATFQQRDDWKLHRWINPEPLQNIFDRLQIKITLNQGSSGSDVTKTTPNGLPIMIAGYTFFDRKPVHPATVDGARLEPIL